MRHEASAYRIGDDVADDEHPLAVVADHPLEAVSLPEGARESPLVVIARVLLRGLMNALQSESRSTPRISR
jgi:hypothetical protein